MPRGEAAVLVSGEPALPPDGVVTGLGRARRGPHRIGPARLADRLRLDPRRGGRRARPLVLVPEVFFRGRRFASEGVALPDQEKLVKVELRQARTTAKINGKLYQFPDQFLINPGKGFLRTRDALDYKLLLTNLTSRRLNAYVTYSLEGLPETGRVRSTAARPTTPSTARSGPTTSPTTSRRS